MLTEFVLIGAEPGTGWQSDRSETLVYPTIPVLHLM